MIMKIRPLRIMHIQPVSLDLFGHQQRDFGTKIKYFLTNIASAQARAGDLPEVHLFSSGKQEKIYFDGIPAHFHRCIGPPGFLGFRKVFARQISVPLLAGLRRSGADIIHFSGVISYQLMFAAVVFWAARAHIPVVASEQGGRSVRFIEKAVQKYSLGKAAIVTACSRQAADNLKMLGAKPDSVRIVPNGFDEELFSPGPVRARRKGDSLKVLVVSRLWGEKDPLTMARAAVLFAGMGYKADLTIIGQGLMRIEVERYLSGVPGLQYRFIEFVPQRELAGFYNRSDVLLLTSKREGMPQVVLEAMACGLPVIATDIPGTRDALGDAGILVPAGEPETIAAELARVADSTEDLPELRLKSIARSSNFTWTKVAQSLRDVYSEALEDNILAARQGRNSFHAEIGDI